jgi:hypothetical protein
MTGLLDGAILSVLTEIKESLKAIVAVQKEQQQTNRQILGHLEKLSSAVGPYPAEHFPKKVLNVKNQID